MRNIPFIIGVLILQALIPQNTNGQSQRIDPTEDRKCSIGGHVTNILTGAPVKRTTVRLNPAGSEADIFASATMSVLGFGASPGKTQYSVASGADGAFCFETAEAGQYSLSGTKPGFLNTNYGAKSPMDSGVNVIVGTQPRNDITLALVPQSVISGRITDDDDEPVNGAFVNLLMRVWIRGQFRNVAVRSARSNDLGEFRVADVSPGTYYIFVQPRAGNPTSDSSSRALLRTFSPGVIRLADATPIVVQAGDERSGVNIRMLVGQTHHVKGRLFGLNPTDRGGVTLLPQGEEQLFIGAGSGNVKPDGTFDFPGIGPGIYTLSYIQVSGEAAKGGRRSVEVGDQDLNDVALAITRPGTIRGHISIEGKPPEKSEPANFQSLHVALTASDVLVGPTSTAAILSNGSFIIQNIITPGRYLVRADAPPGTYLKSVRYGQADVTAQELDLGDGSSGEMDIVYRYGLAKVSGRIDQPQDSGRSEVTPAHVVLIPSVSDRADRGIIFANADGSNAFSIGRVPPGSYRAYAFESIDFAALHEPGVLKALDTVGTDLDVKEGDDKSISLRLISSEEEQRAISTARNQ